MCVLLLADPHKCREEQGNAQGQGTPQQVCFIIMNMPRNSKQHIFNGIVNVLLERPASSLKDINRCYAVSPSLFMLVDKSYKVSATFPASKAKTMLRTRAKNKHDT
jgi:hypothetical protein